MENILQKIDEFLSAHDNNLSKKDAIAIINYLIEDVPDDSIYLETFKDSIENYWSVNNVKLNANFKKILSSYGILNENVSRRFSLELNGKHLVKKFIDLKHKSEIKKILRII